MKENANPISDPKVVKDRFVKEYMRSTKYHGRVNMCGVSNRLMVEMLKRDSDESLETIKQNLIAGGQNPDEPYLLVGLSKKLPKTLTLPEEFEGIKVFVQVIGEIKLL